MHSAAEISPRPPSTRALDVTSGVQPSGLPEESGYTIGFAVLAAGPIRAAAAGLLVPAPVRRRRDATVAPAESGEFAMAAEGG